MAVHPITGRIEDYAMIGDCRTAAIVRRDASIDWLCLPHFDSGACFAALLGTPQNGRWQIAPRGKHQITRRYQGESLVLETHFSTATGKARVIDFMPLGTPESTVVRIVEGLAGHVAMQTELTIRFDYGITVPWVERHDIKTLTAVAGPHRLILRTPVNMQGENMHSAAAFTVRKGDRVPFVLSYGESFRPLPLSIDADIALEETERFWRGWAGRCAIKGPWRKEVMRSLLTLKGLSYAPTGGMLAAATTSLPEKIGGTRNWDYRYCWLRDATFTLLAFLNAGYDEEATVWQHWLMRAVAGSPDQMQPMYSVRGDKRLDEIEITHLQGYEGSRPVRVGNAAAKQLQIDIYGELADVMAHANAANLPPPPRRKQIRVEVLKHLESIWDSPDEGIWEIRGGSRHFVHSRVMAWVAFDRAARSGGSTKRQVTHWKALAAKIHADVCAKGVDKTRGNFVQAYDSDAVDASLLLLPIVGFLPATDKRIQATVREIEKRLIRDGLVLRYETQTGTDGLPPGEGAFLACSFWLVDNYRLMKQHSKAARLFKKLARLGNDVGLFAEEYDPRAKRMLGNFPQAFSHVALVNAAIGLMAAPKGRKRAKSKKKKIR